MYNRVQNNTTILHLNMEFHNEIHVFFSNLPVQCNMAARRTLKFFILTTKKDVLNSIIVPVAARKRKTTYKFLRTNSVNFSHNLM